jgi:hypothetical protein
VAQVYRFTDENGQVRLFAEIAPEPAGTFNGGTITTPLTIDVGSLATAGGIEITGTSGANVKRLGVDFLHTLLSLTGDGVLDLSSDDTMQVAIHGTGGTAAQLQVYDATRYEFNMETSSAGFQVKYGGTVVYAVTANTATSKGRVKRNPDNPATATLSTGTGAFIDAACDRETYTPVTFNPTAGAAATCAVAISPDNLTYYALWTETEPAGLAFDGTIHGIKVAVPAAWYLKLTVVNATIGTTTYY